MEKGYMNTERVVISQYIFTGDERVFSKTKEDTR